MELQPDELRMRLEPLLAENFEKFGELGAAVSVWQNGKSVLDLQGGFRDARREEEWTPDTLVLVWSATKGLASACLLHALQEHDIDISQRVVEFWPEFGAAGKDQITLAHLLSHQAGLAALDRKVDVQDYAAVIEALEKQRPNWEPGTAHGYHVRTFGFLLDELIRRIADATLGDYWRETFAVPLDLDIWIGLPEQENSRVATIYASRGAMPPNPPQFYKDVATLGTFAHKVFSSPSGLRVVSAMNDPKVRAMSFPAFGGIGSARSLAKFYSMLANDGKIDVKAVSKTGSDFFSEKTIGWMTTTLADGGDRVFGIPTAFSAGFMKESAQGGPRLFSGSSQSPVGSKTRRGALGPFGHPGAGGSHAFADPENKIGFAYVMNQMEQTVLPNEKALRLVEAIYQ